MKNIREKFVKSFMRFSKRSRASIFVFSIIVSAGILLTSLACQSIQNWKTERKTGTAQLDSSGELREARKIEDAGGGGEVRTSGAEALIAAKGTKDEKARKPTEPGEELLPVDPAVTIGKLRNGLKYYIRENKKPEKIAALQLVVNVGSVLEDEGEQGLAHFVEHMAFNGTANLKKTDIVDYLESVGMRFGPEVNASTGFDETIYMLEVPADNNEALKRAFQILAEWAYLISFDEGEVERERGIIIEEWRQRSGAGMRIMEKHYPVLFRNSRYPERLPIGKLQVLEKAKAEDLKRFYKKWYRPELMAVIAVGDFKAMAIEDIIKDYFSKIPRSAAVIKRPLYPVPDHDETLYSIAVDPEATTSRVSIYVKKDVEVMKTKSDYRKNIIEYLYTGIINKRLEELTKKPDPPIIEGYTWKDLIVRTKEAIALSATVPDGNVVRGLEAILTEIRRAAEYGITPSELEREKNELLRWIEQAYLERENTPSYSYVDEYTRNFLEDETIPGIEYEYELYSTFVPEITLQEVNEVARRWMGEKNRVVLVSMPQKPGVSAPSVEELSEVFTKVKQIAIAPYEDIVREEPLLSQIPVPGSIVEEEYLEEIGLTKWHLSNGADVYLKPTDFKKDEVLFEAISPGGHSLVKDEEYIATITAPTAIKDGGIGNFNKMELEKKLAGKVVDISPWISEVYEGLEGSASTRDIETLLQLVHLYFTSPRRDPEAFLAYKKRLETRFANRRADPDEVLWDTVREALAQNNFRARPFTVEIINEMDLDTSVRIFRERFKDPDDFTFIFVGSFNIDEIKPFILTYIGGLPTQRHVENWIDLNIDPPEGIVEEKIYLGLEPKSQVVIVFSGSFTWSFENDFYLSAMGEVLDMRLREKVREEQSGSYDTWVWATTQKYPDNEYTVYIGFGCDPDRVEELTRAVFKEIDWIREGKIDDIYITKEREILKRGLEKSLKENKYWLESIATALRRNEDPRIILKREELIDKLNAERLRDAAVLSLNPERYIRVVLYPESMSKASGN
jgi:zinc protease